MKIDLKNFLLPLQPCKRVEADALIHRMHRMVHFCTNLDKIIRAALDHPIAMNGVLLMSDFRVLPDVAHILLISCLFLAHNLEEYVTLSTRLSRNVGERMP